MIFLIYIPYFCCLYTLFPQIELVELSWNHLSTASPLLNTDIFGATYEVVNMMHKIGVCFAPISSLLTFHWLRLARACEWAWIPVMINQQMIEIDEWSLDRDFHAWTRHLKHSCAPSIYRWSLRCVLWQSFDRLQIPEICSAISAFVCAWDTSLDRWGGSS